MPKNTYEIQASLPPEEGSRHTWRRNIVVTIATSSLRRALDVFEEKYPNATTHSVQKRQTVDIIDAVDIAP